MTVEESKIAVAHVADFYRRYPGEVVTFFTRVTIEPSVPDFTLRVALPAGMVLTHYQSLDGPMLPQITHHQGGNNLIWHIEREAGDAACFEFQVAARVAPTPKDIVLESRAVATIKGEGKQSFQAAETARITISAQGQYLDHLPAIYREDEFLGRFLMLFESFWAPIDRQIDSLYYYLDPHMTPTEFLPWLASWIHLVLDERWPEDKRRRLLHSAVALYRKRGTRQGLEEYLEIYTGTKPQIVEHRAHNFRLGQDARLGPGIALGRANKPHTFTVSLRLLPADDGDEDNHAQQELARRRIETIIEAEKPAHTTFTLRLESLPEM